MKIANIVDTYDRPSTTIVHRPLAGLGEYRRVSDRASRVSVLAFPFVMLQQLSAAGLIPSAGAYIFCDDRIAYFGESVRLPKRLSEHAADDLKCIFARDVYVITSSDGSSFDKNLMMDLQFRLTNRATAAALVAVSKGANPTEVELAAPDQSTHDQLFADTLRLLHDAGCWFLHPTEASFDASAKQDSTDEPTDTADEGPITIGISTTPLGSEEFELTYDDVWARGYWAQGHFLVAAGSEVRVTTNGSCNNLTRQRRDDLFSSGALAKIPGVEERRRLIAAVAFPSTNIAAKIICGAHTTPRWLPLPRSRVVVLEGLRKDSE